MSRPVKRRPGDRSDGRLVKTPGIQSVMAYIYPKRTENEVYYTDTLDVTELLRYLRPINRNDPENKITLFQCIIFSAAKILYERKKLNRFVQGFRTYERDKISISFVIKKKLDDEAEESIMVLEPEKDQTLKDISRKINKTVYETKNAPNESNTLDRHIRTLFKLPRIVIALAVRIVRYLDFWGVNPKIFREGDPSYSSLLISNNGSIGGGVVYHHLNNYGTNSIVLIVGGIHNEKKLMPDGTTSIRKMIDIGVTLDERIADGFYFIKSFGLLKYICKNPSILDKPLGEPSGYDYSLGRVSTS